MSDAEYVNPKEFAKVTKQALVTVYRRLRAGKLPAHQSGGRRTGWLIDLAAFRARFTGESNSPTDAAALPPSSGSIGSGTTSKSAATSPSPPRPALNGPRPRWTTRIPK